MPVFPTIYTQIINQNILLFIRFLLYLFCQTKLKHHMDYTTKINLSGIDFDVKLGIANELVYIEKIRQGNLDFTPFFKYYDLGEEIQDKLGEHLLSTFTSLSYHELEDLGYSSAQIREEEYRYDFQKMFVDKSFCFV